MGGPPDTAPLTIDGAHGEGGGQIVRTALALAVTLRRAVTLIDIRARRPKPLHLETVAWTVRQLFPVRIELGEGRPARVAVAPGKEP